jgi:hypothetical protein
MRNRVTPRQPAAGLEGSSSAASLPVASRCAKRMCTPLVLGPRIERVRGGADVPIPNSVATGTEGTGWRHAIGRPAWRSGRDLAGIHPEHAVLYERLQSIEAARRRPEHVVP